jgi:hypothetical protein
MKGRLVTDETAGERIRLCRVPSLTIKSLAKIADRKGFRSAPEKAALKGIVS